MCCSKHDLSKCSFRVVVRKYRQINIWEEITHFLSLMFLRKDMKISLKICFILKLGFQHRHFILEWAFQTQTFSYWSKVSNLDIFILDWAFQHRHFVLEWAFQPRHFILDWGFQHRHFILEWAFQQRHFHIGVCVPTKTFCIGVSVPIQTFSYWSEGRF